MRSALEWLGWAGHGPLLLCRYDIQLFVGYTLPRWFLTTLAPDGRGTGGRLTSSAVPPPCTKRIRSTVRAGSGADATTAALVHGISERPEVAADEELDPDDASYLEPHSPCWRSPGWSWDSSTASSA